MNTLKLYQLRCFSLLWLAYCATYFIRKPLGVVKTVLGAELGLSMSELGWLDTALILPYAVIQIGLPGLSDEYGARRVLCICLVGASVTSYVSSLSPGFVYLSTTLLITGGFLAPCWPASSKMLSSWFQDSRLNSVFGLINTATYTGGLGGTALATALLQYSGWRSVFLPPALFTLAVSLLLLFLRTPEELKVTVPGKVEKTPGLLGGPSKRTLVSLLALSGVKELCLTMFCLKFVRYVMYLWLPLYLVEHLHYSNMQAGLFSTVFDVGGIVGSPVLGVLLDRTCQGAPLKGVTLAMLTGTLALGLFILTASWGIVFNGIFLLVAGASNCGTDSIIAGSVTTEVGEREGGGSGAGVTSLVNGVGNVGGMVEGPLVGLLWSLLGWPGVLPGVLAVSGLGCLASFRAFRVGEKYRLSHPLPV